MRAAILLAAALAGAAWADDPGSKATRDYVAAAGQSDSFEMAEAQVALTASKDPQVRSYAQEMLRDHGQTSASLKDATARSGLKPPPEIVGADQAPLLAALQSAPAAEFSKTYWRHQALGHHSALTTTESYAANGDDAAVRQAANSALPIIRQHLAMAEKMATP